MAFLGSLGKSLGLDTNFGKGLVGGVANPSVLVSKKTENVLKII